MHTWLQDFRYAVRMLRKNVAMTLVIVASVYASRDTSRCPQQDFHDRSLSRGQKLS